MPEQTLANVVHSNVFCSCTLECNLVHKLHFDVLFADYTQMQNT